MGFAGWSGQGKVGRALALLLDVTGKIRKLGIGLGSYQGHALHGVLACVAVHDTFLSIEKKRDVGPDMDYGAVM